MRGKADSVLAMTSDHGSFMRSLADGPAGLSKPLARSLPVAPGALSRHEGCPRDRLSYERSAVSIAPFSRQNASLARLCASKRAVLLQRIGHFGTLCEAKALHLDHFRGRQPGRFSAVNCSIGGTSAALQSSSWERLAMNCYEPVRIGSIRPAAPLSIARNCLDLGGLAAKTRARFWIT